MNIPLQKSHSHPVDDLPGNDVDLSIEEDDDDKWKIKCYNCRIKLVDRRLGHQTQSTGHSIGLILKHNKMFVKQDKM